MRFKRQLQRFRCLLCAYCRADDNAQILGLTIANPARHDLGLLAAALCQAAPQVIFAILGFGVTPQ